MQTYCFKIVNDFKEIKKLLRRCYFKKTINGNSPSVSIKNNFIFFKVNLEELDTNLKKIKFLNTDIFMFKESEDSYYFYSFLIQKNLFLDNPNIAFINDGRIIKLVI